MAEKISAVYKITNTITNEFYIGSSNNVKIRWANHKCPSSWKNNPNKQLYQDMEKYGVDKFVFEILEEVEIEKLKEVEQRFIESLKPTYNNYNANGWDVEKRKESQKKYEKSNKGKETKRKYQKKYDNQLCYFNGEVITICALKTRFTKAGIDHPTQEAKKYLMEK